MIQREQQEIKETKTNKKNVYQQAAPIGREIQGTQVFKSN
jgi:hypothetical protein